MKNRLAHTIRRHTPSGFTLIELLVFIVMIVCVLEGAKVARHLVGGKYAGVLGGLLGFVSFILGGVVLSLFMDLWDGSGLPKCRSAIRDGLPITCFSGFCMCWFSSGLLPTERAAKDGLNSLKKLYCCPYATDAGSGGDASA